MLLLTTTTTTTTTTTWGHHHHHHCCKPLLTGWMGEGEETRSRSNDDERGGHP